MGTAIKDIPIIDVDTHVIEPYDLWTSRLASKWGDKAPQVRWDDTAQEDAWFIGGERLSLECHRSAKARAAARAHRLFRRLLLLRLVLHRLLGRFALEMRTDRLDGFVQTERLLRGVRFLLGGGDSIIDHLLRGGVVRQQWADGEERAVVRAIRPGKVLRHVVKVGPLIVNVAECIHHEFVEGPGVRQFPLLGTKRSGQKQREQRNNGAGRHVGGSEEWQLKYRHHDAGRSGLQPRAGSV